MSEDGKRVSPKPKQPKTKLGLIDLDHSKSAALDGLGSPESKRGYRHAIDEFILWYCQAINFRRGCSGTHDFSFHSVIFCSLRIIV